MAATRERQAVLAVTINGESVITARPSSVAALLAARGLAGTRVAVECNGEIVPRSRHADTHLNDGDRIEIVIAVGGG